MSFKKQRAWVETRLHIDVAGLSGWRVNVSGVDQVEYALGLCIIERIRVECLESRLGVCCVFANGAPVVGIFFAALGRGLACRQQLLEVCNEHGELWKRRNSDGVGSLGPFLLGEFAHLLCVELPGENERKRAFKGYICVGAEPLEALRADDIRVVLVTVLLEQRGGAFRAVGFDLGRRWLRRRRGGSGLRLVKLERVGVTVILPKISGSTSNTREWGGGERREYGRAK
ncbi:hypothetical protein C8F01DRAFT_1133466 [Mycena amicta]|nr:hypothetical protein C8F01DRAFT_1133466 [Mycena amicta]